MGRGIAAVSKNIMVEKECGSKRKTVWLIDDAITCYRHVSVI